VELENKPLLCYVTAGARLAAEPPARTAALLHRIRAAVAADVDWVQIREKDLPGGSLAALARAAVDVARGSRTRIFINDRLDAAVAAAAAGVHLGGESLPVREVKQWCRAGHAPAEFQVGRSCHSLAESQTAERDGADYIFFGPVFASPSKESFGQPQGLEKLAEACRSVHIPVLAIGGVTAVNAGDCVHAGAAGLAAIRLFQDASNVAEVVEQLRHLR